MRHSLRDAFALETLPVLELRTFGGLALRRPQQRDPQPLQAQSKRLALLAYLALAQPRGFHRRDTLLALFWPESDDNRARAALRQALYVLRNELGEGIVVNRGEDEIGLDWEQVSCDAAAFDQAVSDGEYEEALDIYRGDLLPGFHIADAPELVRFLDSERIRYRREAAASAWQLAVHCGEASDAVGAVRWARRAVAIEPHEEDRLRAVIARLDELGDRTAAIGLSEDFARRLADQYELEPAPETRDLVASVRARSSAARPATVPPTRADTRTRRPGELAAASVTRFRTRRTTVAAAIVAVAAASWLVMDVLRRGTGARSSAVPKIAVLPLENTGAAADEWFAAGMTDEITSRLTSVGGLEVIARQSTAQYRGSTKTIGEIAAELDADYLIEGTVQTVHPDGGPAEARIRPQLIRASDETHVWADVFTVPLLASEIFRVQTEVAGHVARALNVAIQESGRAAFRASPTSNTEAYEFFLRGRERQVGAVTAQDLLIAVRMYEGAVERDPGFSVAYAALAEAHLQLWWRYYDRRVERLTSAKAAIDRAMELDSLLPEAQIALGYYHFWGLLEFDRAVEIFETARAARPQSADLLYGIGSVHRRRGRLDEALTNLFRAAEVNPRSALVARDIANTYAFLRNTAEAERHFHRAIALDPGWPTYVRDAMRVHLRLEADLPGTRRILEEARSLGFEHPLLTTLSTWVEISDGNYEAALDLLAAMSGEVAETNSFFIPKAQMYAEVYDLLGNEALRQAYYDSTRSVAEARLERMPNDARVHSALGIAYAGLGRKEEALYEGERGVSLSPVDEDAWQGVYRLESLAVIYTMVGEHENAIDLLDRLLSIPGTLTSRFLELDCRFNALRDHPRVRSVLERHRG